MKHRSLWIAVLALAAGLGAVSSARATWTFTGQSGAGSADLNGDTLATTLIAGNPATDPSLTISGAYAVNGAGNVGFGAGAAWLTNTASRPTFYSGGGLGMSSDLPIAVPNHALDNNGNTESILLSFTSSVVLSGISLGYKSGDADVSVFRWKFASGPTLAGTASSLAGMTGAGWELIGNYGDLSGSSGVNNAINGGNAGSSWWLVTAYNSSYGGATSGTVDQGNDYFKLFSVAGAKCASGAAQCGQASNGVPEPTSLALVALGLLGAAGIQRRQAAARTA